VPFKSNVGSLFRAPPPPPLQKKLVDRSFSVLHFSHNQLFISYFLHVMFIGLNVVQRIKLCFFIEGHDI
jgi:hypothetical protein